MRHGKWLMVFLTLVGLAPGVGHAESAYIVDRLFAIVRTEAIETSPVARTIESGTVVEVLQRTERFTRVRDKQGAEGWVETRYLTTEPPMRVQLVKLQDELTKARAQVAETQAQLKKTEKVLAAQTASMKDMPKLAPGASPPLSLDATLRAQIAKLQDDLNKSRTQAADVQTQLKKTEAALAEQTVKRKELEKTVTNAPVATAAVAPTPPAPTAPAKGAPTPAVAPPSTVTGFTFSFVWLGISFAMLGTGFAAGVAWLRESIRKRSGGMYLRV
jgi:uncharacterized protein YgiM (DUF1202 family)